MSYYSSRFPKPEQLSSIFEHLCKGKKVMLIYPKERTAERNRGYWQIFGFSVSKPQCGAGRKPTWFITVQATKAVAQDVQQAIFGQQKC